MVLKNGKNKPFLCYDIVIDVVLFLYHKRGIKARVQSTVISTTVLPSEVKMVESKSLGSGSSAKPKWLGSLASSKKKRTNGIKYFRVKNWYENTSL